MRLLSYNIHGCVGLDRREVPDRILEVIRRADADVVGLQEVHSDDAHDRNFLHKLEALPYHSVLYGKTMRKASADYGNLLLLRQPPDSERRIELGSRSSEPRGAIIADLKLAETEIRIITTHLDLDYRNRRKQLDELVGYVEQKERCILLGDLNEWLSIRPYFRSLQSKFVAFSGLRTFPSRFPIFGLDRIAARGTFKSHHFHTDSDELARQASDHLPLICDLEF